MNFEEYIVLVNTRKAISFWWMRETEIILVKDQLKSFPDTHIDTIFMEGSSEEKMREAIRNYIGED